MRVLLVEDDPALGGQLKHDLAKAGFAVDLIDNGVDAEFMGEQEDYDLVVLDLGLPQRSGLEVLHHWRAAGNKVPVVILTARDAWHEKVDGFKAGADDYLAKPFHVEELLARMQAVVRRLKAQTGGDQLKVGHLQLDEHTQSVTTAAGEVFPLTGTEFRLLRYFMLHPGRILSKSVLTEHVYDYDSDKDSNVIEVYVNRLRQKLGKALIQTKRGQGYVFEADQA
ncbi:two-component system response regulator [Candidatus Tenderia electrophaga]|jgi:DNA-binding response OmpR family regulator|uniref:Two-component system response regulator n=1 Tax=Candidatus Tenderia electrophaga TaxID=1748243 RepID=A0A0S2TG16_9GAMM|nr:two-component system response regulator [Candidatus Tenderia electrophaga]